MSTTEPSEPLDIAVIGSGTSPRYVMYCSPWFRGQLNDMLRDFALTDTVASAKLYAPSWLDGPVMFEAEILPDKPSQIQKTTRLGLIRHFCGLRGSSVVHKSWTTRKLPCHHDRLRNKRKAWLRSLE